MPLLQRRDRIRRVSRSLAAFEVADAKPSAASNRLRGREAGFEGRHVLRALLQRVAGRNQKPYLVEAEQAHGLQSDAPMTAVRGIEGAPEKTDPRHRGER